MVIDELNVKKIEISIYCTDYITLNALKYARTKW